MTSITPYAHPVVHAATRRVAARSPSGSDRPSRARGGKICRSIRRSLYPLPLEGEGLWETFLPIEGEGVQAAVWRLTSTTLPPCAGWPFWFCRRWRRVWQLYRLRRHPREDKDAICSLRL